MAAKIADLVNGVDVSALKETCSNIQNNLQLARCEFRASNVWMDGGHNQVHIQGYYAAGKEQKTRRKPYLLETDEPSVLFGHDQGASPVEYLLTALSSCMTTSIVYHVSAKGYKIHALSSEFKGDIDLQGFLGLNPSISKGFQKIEATFVISTDTPQIVLEECYHYSPVFSMLSKSVPIHVNITRK